MKRLLVIIFTVHCSLFTALAQDDFGLDFALEAQKKLTQNLSLSLEGELRTRDNTKTVDRWSLGVGADYKLTKWLKGSASYIFIYDNNERTSYFDATDEEVIDGDADEGDAKKQGKYWAPRHRFNVSLTFDKKLFGDFRFSLRERWQYTYRPSYTVDVRWSFLDNAYDGKEHTYSCKGKSVLRSRLQVEYDKKGLKLTPYANVEFFNAWSLQKTRFNVGLDYKLSKQHTIGGFYRYQTVRSDDDDYEPNIHMIGVMYKFKF